MATVYIGYTKVTCALGGNVISPYQLSGGESFINAVRQNKTSVTLVAGDADAQSGTLLVQGSVGAWDAWDHSTNVETTGTLTDKALTFTLVSSTNLVSYWTQAEFVANFIQTINPAKTWSPFSGNIVVHLLGDDPTAVEVDGTDSTNYIGSSSRWNDFKAIAFTELKVSSSTHLKSGAGTLTRDWTTGYNLGAYLLNVRDATFSVTPVTGDGTVLAQKVYAWKLERDGVIGGSLGSENTVTISDFEEDDIVHLYLTTATSTNPRIKYDGFDTTAGSIVPDNESIFADGGTTEYAIGSEWTASSLGDPFTVFLSPTAWAAQTMGIARSVIVDKGEAGEVETPLTNVDGTGVSVTTHSGAYSTKNVTFKEVAIEPSTDNLTVNVVIDAETGVSENLSVSITVKQLDSILGTLSATGSIGYYIGDVPINITAIVDYGGEDPTNFTLRMKSNVVYPDVDVIGSDDSILDASVATREITVYLTQFVDLGNLTEVAIFKTRDITKGTQVVSSAGPITSGVVGDISVEMTDGQSAGDPIYVTCTAQDGYAVKSLYVVDALYDVESPDSTLEFATVSITEERTAIYLNVPRNRIEGDEGVPNIKVILSVEADVVEIPFITYLTVDDDGKFGAEVISDGGYDDFRVGDSVTLSASPVNSITGIAIGKPYFNDVEMIPIRSSVSIESTVTLAPVMTTGVNPNIFKIPVYAEFTPSTNPVEAISAIGDTIWSVNGIETDNVLTIDGTTYYRIGMTYTVTVDLSWTTYTLVSAQINLRAISTGDPVYTEIAGLAPVVASSTTRTFSGTLRGETQCIATFAEGTASPIFSIAAFDYGVNDYITQGERPSVTTVPVSPAVFSDNQVDVSYSWPAIAPSVDYENAAFLIRAEETPDPFLLLPQVTIRASYTSGATLERWNATTSTWIPYTQTVVTLVDAFTYFRVCIGDAPADLVDVKFVEAENESAESVPGGKVAITSGTTYDSEFNIPTSGITRKMKSRAVLYARFTPSSSQYIVMGWYVSFQVDELEENRVYVLKESGASLSIVVPDTGFVLKPLLAIRESFSNSVKILNGSLTKRDDGIWVSKLFRAQTPWRPIAAHVIIWPTNNPVTLGVMKGGGDAPTTLDDIDPASTVKIAITSDKMRRLPPGVIQKSRFMRYMLGISNDGEISSVAIGSGALTMKGGH